MMMKILLLVHKQRRTILDRLYEDIAAHTDCDLRRLSRDEQSNLRRYFHDNVDVDRYERIVLFDLRFKRLVRQALFIRSIPNLVTVEFDVWQNYHQTEHQGEFSAHFRRLPAIRVLSSGFQVTKKLLTEGVDAIFIPKGCYQDSLRNFGDVRDIELAFIGTTKADGYQNRRAVLDAIREHEPEMKVLVTESGNDYCVMLNRIRFFISPDMGMGEYMIKNFEAMACGCVLCSFDQGEEENQALGFIDMENLVLFRSVDELREKLQRLRADPAQADRIAAAGQALVEREYTCARIGERIVEALRPPLRPNPVPGLLERFRLALRL
ncbi:MAG: glycosyltransferase [Azoarcus sp.]|jgi:glycosyltransferase involved in cell wall biosynthesis|nr:glycosyltransferase [Azoarcus sp.]